MASDGTSDAELSHAGLERGSLHAQSIGGAVRCSQTLDRGSQTGAVANPPQGYERADQEYPVSDQIDHA